MQQQRQMSMNEAIVSTVVKSEFIDNLGKIQTWPVVLCRPLGRVIEPQPDILPAVRRPIGLGTFLAKKVHPFYDTLAKLRSAIFFCNVEPTIREQGVGDHDF